MAQWSKFIGAPSRNEFWEPQEDSYFCPGRQKYAKAPLAVKIRKRLNCRYSLCYRQDGPSGTPVPTIIFQPFQNIKKISIGNLTFLLSSIQQLITAHLYLKQLFIKETATLSFLYTLYLAFSLFCFNSLSTRSRSRYGMFQLVFSGEFDLPPEREVANRRSDEGSKSAFLTYIFSLTNEGGRGSTEIALRFHATDVACRM